MIQPACSHRQIRELISNGNPTDALRVAGPMLEANPDDALAWYLGAKALALAGQKEAGLRNMTAAGQALGRSGNPIWALLCGLELEALGGDNTKVLTSLASLYKAGSTALSDVANNPPNLGPINISPIDKSLPDEALFREVIDQMAVCFGMAMGAEPAKNLPPLPLFSALDETNFIALAGCFEQVTVPPGTQIVAQGQPGSAMYVVAFGSVRVEMSTQDEQTAPPTLLAQLGPGAIFGEMAIVSSAPRAASVVASDEVVVLKAQKSDLEALASKVPMVADVLVAFCHARMLENLMRISPVLSKVPPQRRPELIARFDTGFYGQGEVIIAEGAPGPGLFVVVSGAVAVFKKVDDADAQVARLGSGDLFGEISLLLQKPSTATVVAEENTAVLKLGHQDFHEVTDQFPELLKGAFEIALEREKKNNSILGQVSPVDDTMILL